MMWVSKTSELIGSSPHSFEDAARAVLERANRTLRGITGIKVVDEKAKVEDGQIVEFLVTLQVIFLLEEGEG